MPDAANIWDSVLDRMRRDLDGDEFRRWFAPTAFGSDSSDRITVWTPSESITRHIQTHYADVIDRALGALGRGGTRVRFIVSGVEDDEEAEE